MNSCDNVTAIVAANSIHNSYKDLIIVAQIKSLNLYVMVLCVHTKNTDGIGLVQIISVMDFIANHLRDIKLARFRNK